MEERLARTCRNLEKNNIACFYIDRKEEVVPLLKTLIQEGDVLRTGGSVSLKESGVLDSISNGDYRFINRFSSNITPEVKRAASIDAFDCDAYLCSCNAVTENGELYNVDGDGNRTAAMIYGSKQVILIVGCNKVVKNLEEAVVRVKTIAAPKNAARLGYDTYCREKGHCLAIEQGKTGMTDGCSSPGRICSTFVVMGHQYDRNRHRIKVILVGEPLGY